MSELVANREIAAPTVLIAANRNGTDLSLDNESAIECSGIVLLYRDYAHGLSDLAKRHTARHLSKLFAKLTMDFHRELLWVAEVSQFHQVNRWICAH